MEAIELRNKWKKSITKVDENFLRMIDALYRVYQNKQELDFFDNLPTEIQYLLLESKKQAEKGAVKSHEEVIKLFRNKYRNAK